MKILKNNAYNAISDLLEITSYEGMGGVNSNNGNKSFRGIIV